MRPDASVARAAAEIGARCVNEGSFLSAQPAPSPSTVYRESIEPSSWTIRLLPEAVILPKELSATGTSIVHVSRMTFVLEEVDEDEHARMPRPRQAASRIDIERLYLEALSRSGRAETPLES